MVTKHTHKMEPGENWEYWNLSPQNQTDAQITLGGFCTRRKSIEISITGPRMKRNVNEEKHSIISTSSHSHPASINLSWIAYTKDLSNHLVTYGKLRFVSFRKKKKMCFFVCYIVFFGLNTAIKYTFSSKIITFMKMGEVIGMGSVGGRLEALSYAQETQF